MLTASDHQQSAPFPDLNQAIHLAVIATLPAQYQKRYLDPKWGGNRSQGHVAGRLATTAMIERDLRGEEIYLLRSGNIVCMISHNAGNKEATVTFNPTFVGADITTLSELFDIMRIKRKEHPLGGTAHTGFLDKLLKPSHDCPAPLIDRVARTLEDIKPASKPLTVNFCGFSSGGAKTMLAASELIGSKMFDNKDFRLGQLMTFASPGYACPQLSAAMNEQIHLLGGQAWHLETHGDPAATALTPESPNIFTRLKYSHAGNHAYLLTTGPQYESVRLIVQPSHEELRELRSRPSPNSRPHNLNHVIKLLRQLNHSTQTPQPDLEDTCRI